MLCPFEVIAYGHKIGSPAASDKLIIKINIIDALDNEDAA
jgi:hypothetical protein